jgi:hypothetical protein
MSEVAAAVPGTEAVPAQPKTPYDYLALFPGAPSAQIVESYRQQVPGGRLRLLPMKDGNRLFLLRGFTAIELSQVQAEVAKTPAEKQLMNLQIAMAARCTLWASITKNGKLTESDLHQTGAGLAPTLYHSIMDLSDYNDPDVLEQISIDF